MSYTPELYRLQQELRQVKAELRAERESNHTFRIAVAKEKLLQANAADCNTDLLSQALIDGGNPRVDAEGRAILSYGPPEEGRVGTFDEAMTYWRDNPAGYGNIVGIQKHEPTARERLEAKFKDMDMQKYMEGRKTDPNFFEPPPAEPQQ